MSTMAIQVDSRGAGHSYSGQQHLAGRRVAKLRIVLPAIIDMEMVAVACAYLAGAGKKWDLRQGKYERKPLAQNATYKKKGAQLGIIEWKDMKIYVEFVRTDNAVHPMLTVPLTDAWSEFAHQLVDCFGGDVARSQANVERSIPPHPGNNATPSKDHHHWRALMKRIHDLEPIDGLEFKLLADVVPEHARNLVSFKSTLGEQLAGLNVKTAPEPMSAPPRPVAAAPKPAPAPKSFSVPVSKPPARPIATVTPVRPTPPPAPPPAPPAPPAVPSAPSAPLPPASPPPSSFRSLSALGAAVHDWLRKNRSDVYKRGSHDLLSTAMACSRIRFKTDDITSDVDIDDVSTPNPYGFIEARARFDKAPIMLVGLYETAILRLLEDHALSPRALPFPQGYSYGRPIRRDYLKGSRQRVAVEDAPELSRTGAAHAAAPVERAPEIAAPAAVAQPATGSRFDPARVRQRMHDDQVFADDLWDELTKLAGFDDAVQRALTRGLL